MLLVKLCVVNLSQCIVSNRLFVFFVCNFLLSFVGILTEMLHLIRGKSTPVELSQRISNGELKFHIFGCRQEAEVAHAFLCFTLAIESDRVSVTEIPVCSLYPIIVLNEVLMLIKMRYGLVIESSHTHLDNRIKSTFAQFEKLSTLLIIRCFYFL
jgi:hypothetical protein